MVECEIKSRGSWWFNSNRYNLKSTASYAWQRLLQNQDHHWSWMCISAKNTFRHNTCICMTYLHFSIGLYALVHVCITSSYELYHVHTWRVGYIQTSYMQMHTDMHSSGDQVQAYGSTRLQNIFKFLRDKKTSLIWKWKQTVTGQHLFFAD